jgi:hypothetical protein
MPLHRRSVFIADQDSDAYILRYETIPLFTKSPRETVRKGYEQRSERGVGRYTGRKMDRKPLLGGPLGYAGSASETFRTVSEGVFPETWASGVWDSRKLSFRHWKLSEAR